MHYRTAKALQRLVSPGLSKALDECLISQWLPREKLAELQDRHFQLLLNHCRKNVPYYARQKEFKAVKSLADIQKLPILTIADVRNNREALVANNVSRSQLIPMSTSGTTGKKLEFYSDRKNYLSWACTIRGDMWAGYRPGAKQAFLWGIPEKITFRAKLKRYLKNIVVDHALWFPVKNLTDEQFQKYVLRFNKYKPEFFTAYPNSLTYFAEFIEKNDLKIHSPVGIITGGDMLFEWQRVIIERTFKTKILNRYGSTEVFHIAGECQEQNGLHISMEHIYLEILDKEGQPCQAGETGAIVITDLTNYGFPFIRYKIGDAGAVTARKCRCGRALTLLENLQGRVTGLILGPNGVRVSGTFWIDMFNTVIPDIIQFQVYQDLLDHVQIKLIVEPNYNYARNDEIVALVKNRFGNEMLVDIEIVDKITPAVEGKSAFIISKISAH